METQFEEAICSLYTWLGHVQKYGFIKTGPTLLPLAAATLGDLYCFALFYIYQDISGAKYNWAIHRVSLRVWLHQGPCSNLGNIEPKPSLKKDLETDQNAYWTQMSPEFGTINPHTEISAKLKPEYIQQSSELYGHLTARSPLEITWWNVPDRHKVQQRKDQIKIINPLNK